MSNAVWVIISIPTAEREKQLKDCEIPDLDSESTLRRQRSDVSTDEVFQTRFRKDNNQLPLKKILEDSFEELNITDTVWYLTKNGKGYHIYFSCDLESSDSVLEYFCAKRIGSKKETFIGMIPFSLFLKEEEYPEVFEDESPETDNDEGLRGSPDHFIKKEGKEKEKLFSFKTMQEKFLKSMRARLTVAQVVADVRSGAELTFDFIVYVILAAWIAAMGLLDNSVVNTVASMLVSPLMGPVMAMTFGTIARNKALRDMGIRNAVFGFFLCILFGYIFGSIALNFTDDWNPHIVWPTSEMQSRGQARVLWVGTLVALPSGAAVAVSLLSGNQASLVGVAISASLLPPCVNAGLLWSFATIKGFQSLNEEAVWTKTDREELYLKPSLKPPEDYRTNYSSNMAVELFYMGLVSVGLTTVNVICIFVAAYGVLKIKEVTPVTALSSPTSRFWKEDVKIARDYRKTFNDDVYDSLGEGFLREWAAMTGLNEAQILGDTPHSKTAQVQTLQDMLRDVESDEVFQSIVRGSRKTSVDMLYGRRESRVSMAGGRRISRIQLPSQQRKASIFTLPVPEEGSQGVTGRNRRSSSVLLRRSLATSEHQPFSVWPQTRPASETRFTITPVVDISGGRSRRVSDRPRSRLISTEETEMGIVRPPYYEQNVSPD